MTKNPKVGLMSIGLDAYWPQFPGMKEKLEEYNKEIEKKLSAYSEVLNVRMIDSVDKSLAAGRLFAQSSVQILFCHCATYSVSSNMLPAVKEAGCPVVFLNLQPVSALDCEKVTEIDQWLGTMTSGAVPEMTAVLIREGVLFDVITGMLYNDPEVDKEIKEWCDAAKVKTAIGDGSIGLIGQPYEGMMDLYIDRTNLKSRLGIETIAIEFSELADMGRNITPKEIDSAANEILDLFDYENISPEQITGAARVYVVIQKLVKEKGLMGLAYHYAGRVTQELEEIVGTSNVAFSMLTTSGFPCCVEGDVKACIASIILKILSNTSELSEIYSLDYENDVAIMGHSGSGDANISEKRPLLKATEVFHGKTGKGFLTQFYMKKGPVTLLACSQDGDGNFKMICAEGECVPGPVLRLGDTNSRIRFSMGMRKFINEWCRQGPTHHFVMALGHHTGAIEKAARLLGCGFKNLV
jgi:L-arabinose isomerase